MDWQKKNYKAIALILGFVLLSMSPITQSVAASGYQLIIRNATSENHIKAYILSCDTNSCSCETSDCSIDLGQTPLHITEAPNAPFMIIFGGAGNSKLTSCGLRGTTAILHFRAKQACDIELSKNGNNYICHNNCRY